MTLPPLFFLQNMGPCHLFSPWFSHKNNQSGMSGQADYGCFMKRTLQSWTLIYLIFYYLWGWISEQSYTLFSCHFSHCPLILGKKKKQRNSEHSPVSPVFTQHTLCATVTAGAPFLFALVTWEAMWRFCVCFVTSCNHFLFSASDDKQRTIPVTTENLHLTRLKLNEVILVLLMTTN